MSGSHFPLFPPPAAPRQISRASFLRGALAAGAALAAGTAIAGCDTPQTATSAEGRKTLRYNLGGPVATFWPMYAAAELGYLQQAGIDSPLVVDPTNGVQQLLSGDIEGYGTSTDVLALAATKGAPLVGIAGLPRTPYDLVVNEKIRSFADLRGKKIGVALLQGSSAAIMRKMLRSAGLGDNDYELVLAGAASSKVASLQTGAIAAAMFMAPQSIDITRRDNRIRLMGNTSQIVTAPMITSWVSASWASKNRDLVQKWLAAQEKAVQWLADTKNREQAAAILATQTKVDVEACRLTYDQFQQQNLWKSPLSVDFAALDEFFKLVADTGVAAFKPAAQYFDMSYLKAALPT